MKYAFAAMLLAACAQPVDPGRASAAPVPVVDAGRRAPEPLPALVRDPFLTRAEEAALSAAPRPPPAKKAPAPPALRLEALVVPPDGRGKVAIINGRPYSEGERVDGDVLTTIGTDHVELRTKSGALRTLRFEEATAVAAPRARPRR